MSIMFAALVALAVGGSAARAEGWDSKGWVKLGEREVNGRLDHDRIDVGRYDGKFIDFKYRNLPGGGRAKVQVWAR